MKKSILSILIVLIIFTVTACGQKTSDQMTPPVSPPSSAQEEHTPSEEDPAAVPPELLLSTVFSYGGRDYDMREHAEAINAIYGCVPVGKHIVVICHVSPKNNVYGIFNTETETFEPDIWGCNLTWYDDDITTSVYSYWSGIYTYDKRQIADLTLSEDEWIDELLFTNDNASVMVMIRSFFEDEPRVVAVDIETGRLTENVSFDEGLLPA